MASEEDRVTPVRNGGASSSPAARGSSGAVSAPSSNDAIDALILGACETAEGGLTDKQVVARIGREISARARLQAYNRLLSRGRLELAEQVDKNGRKSVVYQWVSGATAARMQGLDSSDRMVYALVSRAGDGGVTRRDLKARTNIRGAVELKQILDRLVARRLIKEIASVQGPRRKVFILAELEPSDAHTGGPWYNDALQFDQEFIGTLYAYVLSFISRMQHVSVEQVAAFVAETNISKEVLRVADVHHLMTTMLYDGQIETCAGPPDAGVVSGAGGKYYRKSRPTPAINQMASVPCGSCPVFNECTPHGVISPKKCVYMDTWLRSIADW